jgi:hypothetical protein
MQDTPRPSDEEPASADALASERERGDDWHPSKPKQKTPGKRYVRRGMAFKPASLERLKPGEPLFAIDRPGEFPAKFKRIGKVKSCSVQGSERVLHFCSGQRSCSPLELHSLLRRYQLSIVDTRLLSLWS